MHQLFIIDADHFIILLPNIPLPLELELNLGVVALKEREGLVEFADFDIFAIQHIVESVYFLFELVEARGLVEFYLPHPLLLIVELLCHFGEFLILFEHEVSKAIIFLTQIFEIASILFLLEQHLLHFEYLSVLLVYYLHEFIVLVL